MSGEPRADENAELSPSTWAEFAGTRSLSAAPTVGSLGVSVRPDRLREWNLGNLNSYWLNLATTDAAYLADRNPAPVRSLVCTRLLPSVNSAM